MARKLENDLLLVPREEYGKKSDQEWRNPATGSIDWLLTYRYVYMRLRTSQLPGTHRCETVVPAPRDTPGHIYVVSETKTQNELTTRQGILIRQLGILNSKSSRKAQSHETFHFYSEKLPQLLEH